MGGGIWSDSYKDYYSIEGLKTLFRYLESNDNYELHFDRVLIACHYIEYKSLDAFQACYRWIDENALSLNIDSLEELEGYLTVLRIKDTCRIFLSCRILL